MARRHDDRKPGERSPRPGAGRGAKPAAGRPAAGRPGAGPPQRGRKPRPTRRGRGVVVTPAKATRPSADDGKVRLNRFLAMSGVASRRAADEVIAAGRVEVNGETVTELGQRIDPANDDVRVDGDRVRQEKPVYVLFNKPKGVVCTNARHEKKPRVIDYLPEVRGRLYTVGRLDMDSEGLIVLTNDGDFALRLTHPRYGVTKIYAVLVRGKVEQKALEKARGGVWLSEGPTSGMQIKIERIGKDRTYLKVMLQEGKNREIRRVFARLDHPVIALKRVRIGELSLHGLSEGKWRFLTKAEVNQLLATSRGDEQQGSER